MKLVSMPAWMTAMAGVCLTMAAPATAQEVARANDSSVIASGRMAEFDLAGVRLGKTPVEVKASLNRAGYKVGLSTVGASYQQTVQSALRERVPSTPYGPSSAERTPRTWSAKGPNGEFLMVSFAPMPGGPRVQDVSLSFDENRTTLDMIAQQVSRKFGPPSVATAGGLSRFWCGKVNATCGKTVGYDSPYLEFSTFAHRGSIRLTAVEPVKRWIDHAIASEIDRHAPKVRPSF